MSWRSLQIRAFVADNVQFVLVALIVLTMVGGFFTYNTHVNPGTEVETVSESNWTSTAEYTHRADVEPGTPGLPPVIENQPVYVKSPAPELEGAYRYTYRATDGGNLSVTIDQTLVLRSSDDETEYWKVEERDLGVTTRQGVEPGDVATNTFEINVTEAASRWERIDESYGGTPGTKEIRVESEVYISGTRNGERIEETRVDGLDIDVDGNLYYVEEDWRKTDSGGQVGEKTIPATYGPVRTAGSPLLLALSLCGLALLGAGYRHDVFEISAPEQAWIDYRGATSEFGEWISVGKIPEETRFQTTIRVDNLGDLVDIAIDSNRRVIRDDFRDLYAVLLEETMYTFEPPEEPAGETGLVARYATVVESAVPNRISGAIPADSPDSPGDRHRDTAERSGDPGQVTDRQTTIKRASPQARRVHETTEDGEQSGSVPTTSQAVLDRIERLRDWVRRRVGATDGAVTAEKSRDRRADGESLDSPTGVQVTDRETSVERATEQERGADEGTETETADAVEQSKLERTLFDGNEDTGEDRANPGSGRSSNRTLRDRIDRLGAFVRTRVHRSRDERPRGGPDQSTDDQAVDSSAPGQVTDEETAVERGERERRPGGAPEAGSETGVTERDWFSRLSSGIGDPDDETAARKATASKLLLAVVDRIETLEDRIRARIGPGGEETRANGSSTDNSLLSLVASVGVDSWNERELRERLVPGSSSPEWSSEAVLSAHEDRIDKHEQVEYRLRGSSLRMPDSDHGPEGSTDRPDERSLAVVTDQNLLFVTMPADGPMSEGRSIAYTDVASVAVSDGLLSAKLSVTLENDELYHFETVDTDEVEAVAEYIRAARDCWQRVVWTVEEVTERTAKINEHTENGAFEKARRTRRAVNKKLDEVRQYLDDAEIDPSRSLYEELDKATADNDRAAIRSRLQEAETLLGKASEQTETRAYSGAYRSYRAAREHLEAARAVARDGAVPEPQEIASKLETVQEGMQDLRTKPLERAEAARDRARSTDDLQASITAWREAFEHYRDALTAGWGTDLEFEGHRDEIQRETEVVVETLVDRHQELATRFEREGDELTDTDVTAAIDNYLEALDQLRQARELATEFRGGSTEKIEEQSGRVARKHAIQRVDILAGDLSENIRNGSSRRSEVNLAIIAKEAWRHVDTGDAELSIESSMVFPANKAHMLALFEAVYENSVTYGRSEVSVRVGTTEEGFYVKDDGPGAVPLDETVFNWGETRNASPGDDEFLTHGTTLEGPGWSVRLAAGVHGGLRFELFPSNSKFVRS